MLRHAEHQEGGASSGRNSWYKGSEAGNRERRQKQSGEGEGGGDEVKEEAWARAWGPCGSGEFLLRITGEKP